MFLHVFWD